MADQRKAIIISTGMDNIQLLAALKDSEVATGASLERIKGLYAKFSEQQAALETRKNEQSLAKLKATDDLKLAEMKRFFAAQAAMYEEQAAVAAIAGGSIPAGMAAGAAGGKIAGEAEAAAKELHGGSTIVRETAVLFREGLRGNFTRMLGSLTILIGAIGAMAAVVAVGTGAIVGLPAYRLWQSLKGEKAGAKELEDRSKGEADDLRKRIEQMRSVGLIDAKTAGQYTDRLRSGSTDDVNFVLGATNRLMPAGGIDSLAGMSNRARAMEDLQRQQYELDHKESNDPKQRYLADTMNLMRIQAQLNSLKESSPEWLEKRKEWNAEYLKQLQDIHDEQNKTAEDKKKALQEETEKDKELATLARDKKGLEIQFAADAQKQSMQFGTARQIAQFGWSWSPRGGWQRTEAGAMAHELETLEGGSGHMGWQTWNRLHGNIGLANQQASREAYLKKTLGDMGFLPKDEKWQELNNHMATLNQQIASVKAGKTLAVTIADVE